MRDHFDRRVLPDTALDFVRRCQQLVPCHLGGGAALAGAWLSHRLSRDIDLFCHDRTVHRELTRQLSTIANDLGSECEIVRDGGGHVRAVLQSDDTSLEVDVVFEPAEDLEAPPPPIDGIVVESLLDLRLNKLTCILSRSAAADAAIADSW